MTRLGVSRIALGTWQLGGDWGSFDEREAIEVIRTARDVGVNLFDTAQADGFGASERLLGRALAGELAANREQIVIATKGGLRRTDLGLIRDSSPEWLRRGVEESLRALRVDYIDLYQVHWPDSTVPVAKTADALQQLVDEGKIRHVGVSNFDTRQVAEFSRVRPVETVQPPYHLFRRDIEASLLPYAREHDIGVLVYGPLAHGLLTGTLDESTTFGARDWRADRSMFRGAALRRELDVVRDLQRFAQERGRSVSQLAIAWTLTHPAVDVAIVGSRRAAHVVESAGALDFDLSPEDLVEIDLIVNGADGRLGTGGPFPEAA
jgi:aryl-alcohol dehydrogenase-like predicted oxidoreductase